MLGALIPSQPLAADFSWLAPWTSEILRGAVGRQKQQPCQVALQN